MRQKTAIRAASVNDGTAAASSQWHQLCLDSPVGMGVLDSRLRFTRFNTSLARFFQFPVDATSGVALERSGSGVEAAVRTAAQAVLDSGKPVLGLTLEIDSAKQDGSIGTGRADFNPLLDADNQVVGVSCLVIDITSDAAVERELKERLAFEKLLSELSGRFVNLPVDNVDAEINSSLQELVEFLDVDRCAFWQFLEGNNVFMVGCYARPSAVSFPQVPTELLDWYQVRLRQGKLVIFRNPDEVSDICGDANVRDVFAGAKSHVGIPISVGGLPLCGLGLTTFRNERTFDANMITGLKMVGEVFANAVSRRQSDRDLRLIESELFHVTRVSTVGQLAASIAHEINQPLCAIVNNAQAAARLIVANSEPDRATIREVLRDIAADSKRAGDVVGRAKDLLLRRELALKPQSMNDILHDVIGLVRSDAIVRRISMETALAADLPKVLADRVQIQQVLLNLLINAMDAIGDRTDDARQVLVRTAMDSDRVRVSVADRGVGLKSDVAARMFEPFFTTKRNGLGMGLAINKTIVDAHGGRLWAEPNGDRGAIVGFDLPSAQHS